MRRMLLLKPYLHTTVLQNELAEKAKYLNIPTNIDRFSLAEDVKLGAKQFAELDKLVKKENEPKYILITTDNLEQGYVAVTYLAAAFNRKHGVFEGPDWNRDLDKAVASMEEWEERATQIPVIEESELRQSMGPCNDPFAMNNMFIQGNQNGYVHRPYWLFCTQHAVCVVSEMTYSMYGGFGFDNGFDDQLSQGLSHFQNNDKVYIIAVNSPDRWQFEDEEERENWNMNGREKWNALILSYAIDEVFVKLTDKAAKGYYKELFRSGFAEKGLLTVGKFSYNRLINMVMSMNEQNKCQLIENIIKYAIKDKKKSETIILTDKDFRFMDRFCRADAAMVDRKKNGTKSTREKMMQELIGMEDVKKQVCNIVNVMKYNRMRARMNIGGGGYHNVHVMLGAPGTAKTTIAKMMGQIMVEEQLLADNRFACVNGAELKGMYVGHSAPKTKMLFEENDIIVIDEAYSLVGDHGQCDAFSKEALAQLIIELENHSMDKLVIFAGYGGKMVSEKNNKMKDFLDANPGIKSRITSTIYFDSYSPEEMGQIFFKIAENQEYHVEEAARALVISHFEKRTRDENFGNGREARSLLENAVVFAASRVLEDGKKKYSREEMQTITYGDVEKAVQQTEAAELVQNPSGKGTMIGFVA